MDQMSFFPTPDTPSAAKSPKAGTSSEPTVYDRDRIVAYAGHQHVITDRTLSLEQIRQMLERSYPELSKDRCDMTYDANTGLIVPVVKGARTGARL
jgi:hypothetical protein